MESEQPEALRLAEFIENDIPPFSEWVLVAVASKLRTQHAAIQRKDALLRQALTYLEESRTLEPINLDWVKGARRAVAAAITKELSQ